MKVLILGATGRVGRHIVEGGIARGYGITALARSPEKLGTYASNIRVVKGDVLDDAAIGNAVQGQDAVVFTVGVSTTGPTTLFSSSTRLLIAAMTRHGVKRLIAITGVGAGDTKGHGGFLYDRIIFPLFTEHRYQDKEVQEAILQRSNLDWTIVRPAPFREGRAKGQLQVVTNVGDTVLRRISPAEVARFILDELEANRYVHALPFIGYSR